MTSHTIGAPSAIVATAYASRGGRRRTAGVRPQLRIPRCPNSRTSSSTRDALRPRLIGHMITAVRIATPFLVRTTDPPVAAMIGRSSPDSAVSASGSSSTLDGVCLVVHLMIAGRLRWWPRRASRADRPGRLRLRGRHARPDRGRLDPTGVAPHGVRRRAIAALDPGGARAARRRPRGLHRPARRRERHTLKRALTDPPLFSGIGNAYSDEILHRARLSPLRMTDSLTAADVGPALRGALGHPRRVARRAHRGDRRRLPREGHGLPAGDGVHGRFGQPCPDCGTPVQRIRYAANEANYCPTCQTDGRLLADRGLSRLLKSDWPRTLDELDGYRASVADRTAPGPRLPRSGRATPRASRPTSKPARRGSADGLASDASSRATDREYTESRWCHRERRRRATQRSSRPITQYPPQAAGSHVKSVGANRARPVRVTRGDEGGRLERPRPTWSGSGSGSGIGRRVRRQLEGRIGRALPLPPRPVGATSYQWPRNAAARRWRRLSDGPGRAAGARGQRDHRGLAGRRTPSAFNGHLHALGGARAGASPARVGATASSRSLT